MYFVELLQSSSNKKKLTNFSFYFLKLTLTFNKIKRENFFSDQAFSMESSLLDIGSLSQIPDANLGRKRRMSSVLLNTRFGVRSYTIKPESPRTKQALLELGLDNQDYHIKYLNMKSTI